MDEEVEKRQVAGKHLFQVLGCDYLIKLKIPSKNPKSESVRIISILNKGLKGRASQTFEHWGSKKDVYLGFRVDLEAPLTNNIILGPYAELKEESKEFRDFWGSNCKIRRFMDGTIKETIEIENRSGPSYIILAIIEHLKSVHFDSVNLQASFFNLSPFIPSVFQTNDPLKRIRTIYSSLVRFLQDEASTENLPIRKIRCVSSVLHYGGHLERYEIPKHIQVTEETLRDSKTDALLFNLQSSSKSSNALDSLPIRLDITTKKYLSPELFAKLRIAYLIDLRRKLLSKDSSLRCVLKGNELILAFKGFMWRISVEEPVRGKDISESSGSIFEFFYNMSLRHNCWSSTAWAIRKWISSRFLDDAIPEVSLDIILSHMFLNPLNSLPPPASAESAFLRFLDFLSFTDFSKTPLILNFENGLSSERLATFDKTFTLDRERLPALCSLTLFDDPVSMHTSNINAKDLTRLINYARQTLHSFLSHDSHVVNLSCFEQLIDKIDKSYDILIHLRSVSKEAPLEQVPPPRKNNKFNNRPPLPIVDFNPTQLYLESVRASYGELARFYTSKSVPNFIGVKLNKEACIKESKSMMKPYGKRLKAGNELVPNMHAMLDDLRILGKGVVDKIEINCKIPESL